MNASPSVVRLRQPFLWPVLTASAVLMILSLLLWFGGGLDRRFLLAHNPLRDHLAITGLAHALSRFGMSALCLLLLAGVAASSRTPASFMARAFLPAMLLCFAAAAVSATLLKELLGRARPIADLAGQLNAAVAHGTASFPSGHAAKSLALALPFVLAVPAGSFVLRLIKLALLLIAGLVCYSRIVLGAHYLSDVLAGVALAFACVPVAVMGANAIYARGKATPDKLDAMANRPMAALLILALALPFL